VVQSLQPMDYTGSSFFMGVFISTIGNGIMSQGTNFNTEGFVTLVRYVYWMIVFVITSYFASQESVIQKLTKILGWAVLTLALIRWFEGIAYGKIGAWTGTVFLNQNSYGALFSIFSPYLLIMVLQKKRCKQLFTIGGNFLLWGVQPLIARIPGVTDLANIDGETGFYCKVGDLNSLKAAMIRLGTDEVLRKKLGEAARERVVMEFGWEAHVNQWEQLYYSLTTGKS